MPWRWLFEQATAAHSEMKTGGPMTEPPWGGFVPLLLTFFAEHFDTGLAVMMIIGTWIGCLAWTAAAFYGSETKGKVLVLDLVVA
jgi:hypothetical protein